MAYALPERLYYEELPTYTEPQSRSLWIGWRLSTNRKHKPVVAVIYFRPAVGDYVATILTLSFEGFYKQRR